MKQLSDFSIWRFSRFTVTFFFLFNQMTSTKAPENKIKFFISASLLFLDWLNHQPNTQTFFICVCVCGWHYVNSSYRFFTRHFSCRFFKFLRDESRKEMTWRPGAKIVLLQVWYGSRIRNWARKSSLVEAIWRSKTSPPPPLPLDHFWVLVFMAQVHRSSTGTASLFQGGPCGQSWL